MTNERSLFMKQKQSISQEIKAEKITGRKKEYCLDIVSFYVFLLLYVILILWNGKYIYGIILSINVKEIYGDNRIKSIENTSILEFQTTINNLEIQRNLEDVADMDYMQQKELYMEENDIDRIMIIKQLLKETRQYKDSKIQKLNIEQNKNKVVSQDGLVEDKVIYLTIDDGPTKKTSELLKILEEHDVEATFFVTAQFLNRKQIVEELKRIKEKGHQIAVHTYSHDYKKIYKSVDAYVEDYQKMEKLIVEATGECSRIFRFPGGSNAGYNEKIREELIAEMNHRGLIYYDWNAFDGDTDGLSKEEMKEKAITEAGYKNKSILLIHDIPGESKTLAVLPDIIKELKAQGYRFAKLDETVEAIQFIK